jgi:hypothetical protein
MPGPCCCVTIIDTLKAVVDAKSRNIGFEVDAVRERVVVGANNDRIEQANAADPVKLQIQIFRLDAPPAANTVLDAAADGSSRLGVRQAHGLMGIGARVTAISSRAAIVDEGEIAFELRESRATGSKEQPVVGGKAKSAADDRYPVGARLRPV